MRQRVAEILIGIQLPIPADPRLQLFRRQRRLQIDPQAVPSRLHLPHMGTGAENHRAGYAEMCKQHLSEIGIHRFPGFAVRHRKCTVFQRQSLRRQRPAFHAFERHQRRTRVCHRMSGLPRQPVAVPGAPRPGIGGPAGAYRHGGRLPHGSVLTADSHARSVLQQKLRDPSAAKPHAPALSQPHQSIHHILGPVGHRKHTAAAFHLERYALRLHQRHHILRRKAAERTV